MLSRFHVIPEPHGHTELLYQYRASVYWRAIKNDWMRLENRMEARFSTFSANYCDWISISCSKTCWTYWLFCTPRPLNTLLRISLLKQKRITSYFLILFSNNCSLKILFLFVWFYCWAVHYCKVWNVFYKPPDINSSNCVKIRQSAAYVWTWTSMVRHSN